jgi:hypothetical protein
MNRNKLIAAVLAGLKPIPIRTGLVLDANIRVRICFWEDEKVFAGPAVEPGDQNQQHSDSWLPDSDFWIMERLYSERIEA